MAEPADEVNWSLLSHRLGIASDTPRHLEALLGDDPRAFVDGYAHLWAATLRREGGAWPATAPTALRAAALLDDPLLGPDDPSLRDAMLAYLYSVAVAADLGDQAAEVRVRVEDRAADLRRWTADNLAAGPAGQARMWTDGTQLGELVLEQATLACFDAVPEILKRVLPHLASQRGRRRACAAAVVGVLARHPSASARRPLLSEQLASMARAADCTHDRATILIAIGQLGGDTCFWLGDPHAGVRGCAALAPGLARDHRAGQVLRELAEEPRVFADSFGDMAPPLQFHSQPYQDLLASALRCRVDGIGRVAASRSATPDR